MGLGTGMLNGIIVAKIGGAILGCDEIGTSFFWRGVVKVLTGAPELRCCRPAETFFYDIFAGRLFGSLPMQIVWMVLFALFCWLLLNRHRFRSPCLPDRRQCRQRPADGGRCRPPPKSGSLAWLALPPPLQGLAASLEVTYYLADVGRGLSAQYAFLGFFGRNLRFGGRRHALRGRSSLRLLWGPSTPGLWLAIGMSGFWTELDLTA
jgi:simple sugar transport system permease protein